MMPKLRRFLQRLRPSALLVLLAGAGLFLWSANHSAFACWNIVETQCFSQDPIPQIWGNGINHPIPSNRYWKHWPNYPNDPASWPSWDWQREYFDDHMCPNDVAQALWCAGWPRSNDPRYNFYPPWDSAYVTYGPIDLSQAVAGGCSFYFFNRTEVAHDSLFWGVTTVQTMHTAHDSAYLAGTYSGIMPGQTQFQLRYIDFAHLYRIGTTDTVSLLGRSPVWVFWRFWSDGNANTTNIGSFLDNVQISWDDGGMDLDALSGSLYHMDGTPNGFPAAGDSSYGSLSWLSCPGGIPNYPTFRAVVLNDTSVVLDTMIVGATQGMSASLLTRPWVLSPDTHYVRLVLDSMNDVNEVDETNNVATFMYVVPPVYPPPSFNWITPSDSIVYADRSVTLRWEAYDDPNFPATLSFFHSTTPSGCAGLGVENGRDILVADGVDSLVWDLTQFNYERILNVYVRVHDAHHDTCMYAPHPVVRRHSAGTDDNAGSLIPDHFYLNQNYPNPFNPTTDIRFGVARSGHVTLRIFDLLGREVVTLVNADRSPGNYSIAFDGSKLPSGLYLYSLTTPEGTQSRKMMLMK